MNDVEDYSGSTEMVTFKRTGITSY